MATLGIQLSWIVVKDLEAAIAFYTKVVGLTLKEKHPEYGWAELSGPEGARLGISQESPQMDQKAGANAVMTVTVSDLEEARVHFLKQGAKLIGEVIEVPGHVKMQTFADSDGNILQLVEDCHG
jgi:predicted enzyme related to lactoylglutathione lyase